MRSAIFHIAALLVFFLGGCATSPKNDFSKNNFPVYDFVIKVPTKKSNRLFIIKDGDKTLLSLSTPENYFSQKKSSQKTEEFIHVKGRSLCLLATAYYAPLKNQRIYATGDYDKEVRLNGQGKRTSDGSVPKIGTIAADTKLFPYGTKFFVEGYGFGIVQDTGGAIKGKRIDLFMGKGEFGLQKALRWGKKTVNAILLE